MPSAFLPTAFIDAPFIQVNIISAFPFGLYVLKSRRLRRGILFGRVRWADGAHCGNGKLRELIDRVQDVTRNIMTNATSKGYDMRHVGDDPERYGVIFDLNGKRDGVCTSWVICND